MTQDLLDFLARWPLAGTQQRQYGPAGRRLEDLDRLEAEAAGMGDRLLAWLRLLLLRILIAFSLTTQLKSV